MPEKTLNQVPRDVRELYQKGTTALTRQNLEYAVAIFQQVLQKEPGFFDCRQALRAAQFKKSGSSTGFFKKVLGGASSSPAIAKAQLSMRKEPLEAIQTLEQVLSNDPSNSSAHKALAEAAMAADLPRTAALSLEILLKNSPGDYNLNMQYGEALKQAGQVAKAENHYAEMLRVFPHKPDVAQALKNLSARKTLEEDYGAVSEGGGSYRDILKDKEEAVALEQEKREVKSEDVADRLIHEYELRLKTQPNNLKLLRSISELHLQKKDFDKALEFAERIRSSEGGADPSLDRLIADIHLRRFDHRAAQLDPAAPDYPEQTAKLQAERLEFQLVECKARVDRYPADLQIRFEMGERYFEAGKISEAIQEFQRAQQYPARKVAAMGYLGQCFSRRNMHDMAARKFQDALKEKPVFDDEKKELIYQLGCTFEKMGKREEAIEQFKQIYEVDIGYKDVQAKVEGYYSGGAA